MPSPRMITAFGETHSLSEWARIKGIDVGTLKTRINRLGWDAERAIATPAKEGWANKESHGLSNTPEYLVWQGMRERCHNPNSDRYASYGGRGIFVCDRWRYSFAAFIADLGPRPSTQHSLDRIDNDGPYSPENVRWATDGEQRFNKRNTIRLAYHGQRLTIAEAEAKFGVPRKIIYSRLGDGWSVERALQEPVRAVRVGDHSPELAEYAATLDRVAEEMGR